MPIQIIDNFELNVQKPIDNRFVVGGTSSFYNTRFAIVNPYNGLRIWDLNDNQPYVYNGTTWSSEASLTTLQGTGTANYLPKFNTSNSVENSVVYQNSGNIIIGTTSGSPSDRLVVDGNIRVNSGYYYYGSGLYLTSLNATEITTGTLNLARLQLTGSSNWILSRNASTATWTNPTQLTVGTASALATTRTLWGQNFNGTANVTGNINVNGSVNNVSNIVFRNNALPTPGTLNMIWSDNSNLPKTLTIPGWNGTNRTIALLQQAQTFTAVNTFNQHTNLDTVQVAGTSSFFDEMRVFVTKTINYPLFGPVAFTTNPLNVLYAGISVGATTSNASPYIKGDGGYTWYGDNDTSMYRSTAGNIAFKTDNYLQMVMGRTSSYTGVENYTTPGISMISVLDIWSISDFDTAAVGLVPKWFWLENNPFGVVTTAISLPYTNDALGTSGPGAGFATAGLSASSYDRMIMISTSGRTVAFPFLETAPGTGVYWQLSTVWRDSTYPLIIPAGRKWKLSMFRVPAPTDINVNTNDDSVRFIMYKFGLS